MTKSLVFLQSQDDFDQFRRSKLYTSASLKLRVRFNTNQNIARFGFIIPKKVLIKVTDRNKVKRRLKNILQRNLIHIRPADFLFFPGKTALKVTFGDLESELLNIFKLAKVWKQ
jgi:ribonuclease P protein component